MARDEVALHDVNSASRLFVCQVVAQCREHIGQRPLRRRLIDQRYPCEQIVDVCIDQRGITSGNPLECAGHPQPYPFVVAAISGDEFVDQRRILIDCRNHLERAAECVAPFPQGQLKHAHIGHAHPAQVGIRRIQFRHGSSIGGSTTGGALRNFMSRRRTGRLTHCELCNGGALWQATSRRRRGLAQQFTTDTHHQQNRA